MSYLDACKRLPGLLAHWPQDDSAGSTSLRDAVEILPRRSKVGGSTLVTGDGKWNAWGGACVMPNGELLVAYTKRAISSGNTKAIYGKTSADGTTWSAEKSLIPETVYRRIVALMTHSSGSILLSNFVDATEAKPSYPVVFDSTDNSASWTEHLVTHAFGNWAAAGGPAFECKGGDLLLPLYGADAPEGRTYIRISKSTDVGHAWEDTEVEVKIEGKNLQEPSIERLADGRLVLEVRVETAVGGNDGLYHAYSEDEGETWTELELVIWSVDSRGIPLTAPDDDSTWTIQRRESAAGTAPTTAYGTFDGDRYGLPVDLDGSGEANSNTYGQLVWFKEALWAIWFESLTSAKTTASNCYIQKLELKTPGVPLTLTGSAKLEQAGPTSREPAAKAILWEGGGSKPSAAIPALTRALYNRKYSAAVWVNGGLEATTRKILQVGFKRYIKPGGINKIKYEQDTTHIDSGTLAAGWHLIVITVNNGMAKLYIDGVLAAEGELPEPSAPRGEVELVAGTFTGKTSLASLWDSVLTPGHVTSLWEEVATGNFLEVF